MKATSARVPMTAPTARTFCSSSERRVGLPACRLIKRNNKTLYLPQRVKAVPNKGLRRSANLAVPAECAANCIGVEGNR